MTPSSTSQNSTDSPSSVAPATAWTSRSAARSPPSKPPSASTCVPTSTPPTAAPSTPRQRAHHRSALRLWHVSGLDNYSIPRPMLVKRATTPQANGIDANKVVSHATTGSGPSASFLGSDMRAAYYGGGPLTGAGQNLGLLRVSTAPIWPTSPLISRTPVRPTTSPSRSSPPTAPAPPASTPEPAATATTPSRRST